MTSSHDKIEQLRDALADYAASGGGTLFDDRAEEAKAAVRKRALGLLDQRARSRVELAGRLAELDFDAEVVESVLDDLERVGLLDDEDFAKEWVRQRHARRGKSARVLDRELQQKGVSDALRARALAQVSLEDEEGAAREAARKKARTIKTVPVDRAEHEKALRRIVGVLARRGYSGDLAIRIAREALGERMAELADE